MVVPLNTNVLLPVLQVEALPVELVKSPAQVTWFVPQARTPPDETVNVPPTIKGEDSVTVLPPVVILFQAIVGVAKVQPPDMLRVELLVVVSIVPDV